MKRIVNVKRFIISNVILFLGVFLLFSTIINHTYSYIKINYKTVYAEQGDTLWKIANSEKEKNKYYKDTDVRDIINDIKKVNNLKISNLQIGQELLIPTY